MAKQKNPSKNTDRKPTSKTGGLGLKSLVSSLFLVGIGIYAALYLGTDGSMSLDHLKDYPAVAKFNQFKKATINSVNEIIYGKKPEVVFTAAELAEFDGSDPSKPIYLAIKGRVYDVTKGASYYGKNGSYKYFAGKDASRAYITGCFQTHLIPDLRGLSEKEIEGLNTWIDFYEKSNKYFYVGRVIHDPIDPDSPLPAPCQKN